MKKEKKQSMAGVYTFLVILLLLVLGVAGAGAYMYMMIMPKIDDAMSKADQAFKKANSVSDSVTTVASDVEMLQADLDSAIEEFDSKIETLSKAKTESSSEDSGDKKEFKADGFPFTFSYTTSWTLYEPGAEIAGNKVRSNELIFLNAETKAEYDKIQEEGLETEGPQPQLIVKSYPGKTVDEVEKKYITNDATLETKEEVKIGDITAYKYKMQDSLYEDDYIYFVQKGDDVVEFSGPSTSDIETIIGTMK
ncbi:hypothetical protein KKH43_02550 [Patescibacteria group bacterium]|nr:hypothetical protein [Patescibacteria group bacterium]